MAPRAPAASAAKLLTLATAHGPEEKRVSPLAELTPYARRSPDDATVLPAFCLLNVRTHGHCTRPRIPIAIGHQSHQHPITAHRPWSAHTRPRARARARTRETLWLSRHAVALGFASKHMRMRARHLGAFRCCHGRACRSPAPASLARPRHVPSRLAGACCPRMSSEGRRRPPKAAEGARWRPQTSRLLLLPYHSLDECAHHGAQCAHHGAHRMGRAPVAISTATLQPSYMPILALARMASFIETRQSGAASKMSR